MRTPPFVTVMGVAPPAGPPPAFLTMGGIITFFTFGGIVTPEVVAVVIKTVPPAPVEVTAGTFKVQSNLFFASFSKSPQMEILHHAQKPSQCGLRANNPKRPIKPISANNLPL